MKTKSLPAIIMLVAGFIDCILGIYYHQSLWDFTRQLLLVLVIFYLLGCTVKIVIDINFKPFEEIDEQNADVPEDGSGENEAEGQQAEMVEPGPEDLEDIQSDSE